MADPKKDAEPKKEADPKKAKTTEEEEYRTLGTHLQDGTIDPHLPPPADPGVPDPAPVEPEEPEPEPRTR